MKLVMDEKLKHRLIGLAVIVSLGAIFAPAVMRKSSQHLENNFSVNIKLPPKPLAPNVAATDEKDLFKTIKVARVRIPAVPAQTHENDIAKAEPISSKPLLDNTESQLAKIEVGNKVALSKLAVLNEAANRSAKKAVVLAANVSKAKVVARAAINKVPVKAVKVAKIQPKVKSVSAKNLYAVQLASFSQLSNAQSLVTRLQSKGYKASYVKIASNNGAIYKVYAGHSASKNEVLRVKSQLASAMQLNGFVVNTGVS